VPGRSATQPVVKDALSGQRWAPPALADESTQLLRDTGANLVASTLAETRTYLAGLVDMHRLSILATTVHIAQQPSTIASIRQEQLITQQLLTVPFSTAVSATE
jgi:hypothetical protein